MQFLYFFLVNLANDVIFRSNFCSNLAFEKVYSVLLKKEK